MNTESFEQIFENYFKKLDTPVKKFIFKTYLKDRKNKTYALALSTALEHYGIYAFDSFSLTITSKYIPFINCQSPNIFDLKPGITDLSTSSHSLKESQRILAKFLIEQFDKIPLQTFKQWPVNQ